MTIEEKNKKVRELRQQLEEGKSQVRGAMKEYRLIQKESMLTCLRIMEENGFFSEDGLKLLTFNLPSPLASPHIYLNQFRRSCEGAIEEIDKYCQEPEK